MPVMDEFKEEREALKHGTPKQKLQYFWDYYKWPTAIGLFVLLLVFLFVKDIVTNRKIEFFACMLNGAQIDSMSEETPVETTFSEILGLDAKKQRVYFDTSIQIGQSTSTDYVNIQKLMVYMSSSEIDVMISDIDSMIQYMYQNGFADLNEVLRPDQIEKYKDNFLYMDMAYYRVLQEESIAESTVSDPQYPDPTKPELMEEPVAVGFYPVGSTPLDQDFVFGKQYLISIMKNTEHMDYCLRFVDFLSE